MRWEAMMVEHVLRQWNVLTLKLTAGVVLHHLMLREVFQVRTQNNYNNLNYHQKGVHILGRTLLRVEIRPAMIHHPMI